MTIHRPRHPHRHGDSGAGVDSSAAIANGTNASNLAAITPAIYKVVGALVLLGLGALGVADIRWNLAGTSDAVHTQSARVTGQIDSLGREMRVSLGGLGERIDELNKTIQTMDRRVTALERFSEMEAFREDLLRRFRWDEDMRSWRGRQKTSKRLY